MGPPVIADVFASPAVAVLGDLEADGFRVELTADGAVSIAPRARLTPERMAKIAAQKDALKALLRCCDDGVLERRGVFAQQCAAAPACHVPAFLFRAGVAYVAGVCFSCGDTLEKPRYGRCWRCALAWRLACRLPISSDLAAALDGAKVLA